MNIFRDVNPSVSNKFSKQHEEAHNWLRVRYHLWGNSVRVFPRTPPPLIRWGNLFPNRRGRWLLMAHSCSSSWTATSDRMEPGERLYLPLQMGIPHSHGLADLRDKRPVLLLQDGLSLRENIMLQSSPWHQAEARLQMRPHPCFTSFPSLSCFLFSFFPKSIP